MTTNRLRILAFATLISIVPLPTARAVDPPAIVNYQGVLLSTAGSPANGTYNMVFRFFDSDTGSGELLADSHIGAGAVAVANGVFSLQLGAGSVSGPTPSLTELLANFASVYLQVEVEGEALMPRIRIVSSFYALNSAGLGGHPAEDFVDIEGDQVKTGNLTLDGSNGGGNLVINGGGKLKLNEVGSDLTIENGSKVLVQAGGSVVLDGTTGGGDLTVRGGGDVVLESGGSDIRIEKGSKLMVQDGGNVVLDGSTGGGDLMLQGGGDVLVQSAGSDIRIEKGSKLMVQDGGNVVLDGTTGGGDLTLQGGGDVVLESGGSDIRIEKGSKLMVQDGGNVVLDGTTGGGDLTLQGGGDVVLESGGSDIRIEKGSKLMVQDGGGILLDGTAGGADLTLMGGGDVVLESGGSDIRVAKGSKLMVQEGGGILLDGTAGGADLTLMGGGDVVLESGGSDIRVAKGSKLMVQEGGGILLDGTAGGADLTLMGGGDVVLESGGSDIRVAKGSKLMVQEGGGILLDGTAGGADLTLMGGGDVVLESGGSDIRVAKGSKLMVQEGGGIVLDGTAGGADLTLMGGGDVVLESGGSDIRVAKGSKLMVQEGGGIVLDGTAGGADLTLMGGGDVVLESGGSDIRVAKGSKLMVQEGGSVVLDGTAGGARLTVEGGGDIVVKAGKGNAAPLQQWQDSDGVVLAAVSATGGYSGDGSALANLSADHITSGTVPVDRIGGDFTNRVTFSNASNIFSGDGAGLTNIHASNADTLNGLASTAFARLATLNTFATTQTVQLVNPAVNALVVQGAASQTANLQEWRNSSGTTVASIGPSGTIGGNGSALTGLNAANLSGTLPSASLSGTYGNAVTFTSAMSSFNGNGAGLGNLNATNLLSGTLPSARLSGIYSGAVTFSNAMNNFTGNGQGLTNVVADLARRVNEKQVAVVVAFLESGSPTPGSHYYTSLSDAFDDSGTWCGASPPCVIQIMPGSYVIDDEIEMVPGIDVVGSGQSSTSLFFSNSVARIVGAADSSLRALELVLSATAPPVELSAGTLQHVSIVAGAPRPYLVNISGTGALEDVSLEGGSPSIHVSGGSPRLSGVRISAPEGITIDGGSSPTLSNVTVAMTPNAGIGAKGIMVQAGAIPSLDGVTITGTSVAGIAVLKGINLQSGAPSPKMKNVTIRLSGPGTLTGVELGNSNVMLDGFVIEVDGGSPMRGILVQSSTLALRGSRVRAGGAGSTGIEISGTGSTLKVDQCVIAAEGPTTAAIAKPSGNSVFVGASKLDAVNTVSGGGVPFPTCVFTYNGNYLSLNSSCN